MAKAFDVEGVRARLESGSGGYEVVYSSPAVEIGVYVLVAPEPDRQQPHEDDEVYVVLEGRGVLDVEGKRLELTGGHAAFVPAGAEHRFVAYESLSTRDLRALHAIRRLRPQGCGLRDACPTVPGESPRRDLDALPPPEAARA